MGWQAQRPPPPQRPALARQQASRAVSRAAHHLQLRDPQRNHKSK